MAPLNNSMVEELGEDQIFKVCVSMPGASNGSSGDASTDTSLDGTVGGLHFGTEDRCVLPCRLGLPAALSQDLHSRTWDASRFVPLGRKQSQHSSHRRVECYRDTITDGLVAVKRFARKLSMERQAGGLASNFDPSLELRIGQWIAEGGALPFACPYHGVFADCSGDKLLVMPWMHGGDLFDYIADLGTPGFDREATIMPIVKSLFAALSSMHTEGLAHGNITAEHIVFKGPKGRSNVAFIDFGMAVAGRLGTVGKGARVTSLYSAPELHRLSCYDAFATDLFAAGVVIYSLAVGRYPWLSTKAGECKCFDYVQRHGLSSFLRRRRVPGTGGRTAADCLSERLHGILILLLSSEPGQRYEALRLLPDVHAR